MKIVVTLVYFLLSLTCYCQEIVFVKNTIANGYIICNINNSTNNRVYNPNCTYSIFSKASNVTAIDAGIVQYCNYNEKERNYTIMILYGEYIVSYSNIEKVLVKTKDTVNKNFTICFAKYDSIKAKHVIDITIADRKGILCDDKVFNILRK